MDVGGGFGGVGNRSRWVKGSMVDGFMCYLLSDAKRTTYRWDGTPMVPEKGLLGYWFKVVDIGFDKVKRDGIR
jgi:hypothetical protein